MTTENKQTSKPAPVYSHKELGMYIERTRKELGISIKQLCDECHLGHGSYDFLKKGRT